MIAATKVTSFRLISVLMSVMTADVICTKALKLALGYVPIQEKVHKLINFNQEAWLKLYIKREIKFKDCKKVPGIQENDTKITSKVEEGVGQSIHGNTNRIALSTNDDKRLQPLDQVISYPYGTSRGRT